MAEKLYRIGEAAKLLDVKTSVLRFWEDCFTELAPVRTEKGQRLYRESDIAVLRQIQHLLYERGLTIEGARRALSLEDITTATEQASLFNLLPHGSKIITSVPSRELCDAMPVKAHQEYAQAHDMPYHAEISEQNPVVATACVDDGVLCAITAELQRLRDMLT
ncbi:MAG: MerR family transcriptional regulator [Pseudomonadota bacterium]